MPGLSPTSRTVKKYYDTLARYDGVGAVHEQAVRTAFHEVLQAAAGRRYTVDRNAIFQPQLQTSA